VTEGQKGLKRKRGEELVILDISSKEVDFKSLIQTKKLVGESYCFISVTSFKTEYQHSLLALAGD